MTGELDLSKLLAGMSPELDPQTYVFATTTTPEQFADLDALMRFTDGEGETLILKAEDVPAGVLTHSGKYSRITLKVHSSLEAVGFLAAVCSELVNRGISTNAVAGYYHDHIFVPFDRAEEAQSALEQLSNAAREA